MTITANDLRQFTGSETVYRHNLVRGVTYTEGAQYLAEQAGAYWLLDSIACNQLEPKIRREPFQSWKLVVADDKATLTCEDGNGNVKHTEEITFTDFPLPEITLWVEQGVILLPSEH